MEVEKMLKLDYSLSTPEERKELVEKILEENPNVNDTYLETLADYLIIAVSTYDVAQEAKCQVVAVLHLQAQKNSWVMEQPS